MPDYLRLLRGRLGRPDPPEGSDEPEDVDWGVLGQGLATLATEAPEFWRAQALIMVIQGMYHNRTLFCHILPMALCLLDDEECSTVVEDVVIPWIAHYFDECVFPSPELCDMTLEVLGRQMLFMHRPGLTSGCLMIMTQVYYNMPDLFDPAVELERFGELLQRVIESGDPSVSTQGTVLAAAMQNSWSNLDGVDPRDDTFDFPDDLPITKTEP